MMLRLSLLLFPLFSCSDPAAVKSATREIELPPAPASAEAVIRLVRQHQYAVHQVGFAFNWFGKDTTTWEGALEDTSQFFRENLAGYRSTRFEFGADSSIRLIQKKEAVNGTWSINRDHPSAPLQLQITYLSKAFNLGNDTTAQRLTQTFVIRGADEQRLHLESPHKMNGQQVILLMNQQ